MPKEMLVLTLAIILVPFVLYGGDRASSLDPRAGYDYDGLILGVRIGRDISTLSISSPAILRGMFFTIDVEVAQLLGRDPLVGRIPSFTVKQLPIEGIANVGLGMRLSLGAFSLFETAGIVAGPIALTAGIDHVLIEEDGWDGEVRYRFAPVRVFGNAALVLGTLSLEVAGDDLLSERTKKINAAAIYEVFAGMGLTIGATVEDVGGVNERGVLLRYSVPW